VQAQEAKIADRPLDVGISASADPDIHEAVYMVLKNKGISCDGLSTKKDGVITILNPSSTKAVSADEINTELAKIKQAKDYEALIQAEIRKLAIASLIKEGKIPADYK
jgi:hypothetical protein